MFESTPEIGAWVGLLFLGVFQLGLSYVLYTAAVKRVRALEAILIPVIDPILNPLWVLILVGEVPSGWAIGSGLIVLSTVVMRGLIMGEGMFYKEAYTC